MQACRIRRPWLLALWGSGSRNLVRTGGKGLATVALFRAALPPLARSSSSEKPGLSEQFPDEFDGSLHAFPAMGRRGIAGVITPDPLGLLTPGFWQP